MDYFWVASTHKQAPVCRHFAKARGFLLPGDAVYLVCIDDEKTICGLSAMNDDPTDPFLLFIYVPEERRGQGIGSGMIMEILRAAEVEKISSIRCYAEPATGVDAFLEHYGFDLFPGSSVYRITYAALRYSKQYQRNVIGKMPGRACAVSAVGKEGLKALMDFFGRMGLTWGTGYDSSISMVEMNGENVDALMLCDRVPTGLIIKYLYSGKDKAASIIHCFRALNKLMPAEGTLSPGYSLYFALGGVRNYQLIRNLAGDDTLIDEELTVNIAVKLL